MRGVLLIVGGIISLFFLTILGGSYYTVDSGYRGVVLRNGKIIGMAEPGLGFKTPWIENVREFSIGTKTLTWSGQNRLEVYSKDKQVANVNASVNYAIVPDQVGCIYSNYGADEETLVSAIIAPRVQNNVKNVFGTYDATKAINEGAALTRDIGASIEAAVNSVQPCGKPVVTVSAFNLENIDFSDAYEHAVENQMVAQIGVETAKQTALQAKQAADMAFNVADGRARAVERAAAAEAKRIQLEGDAAAAVVSARGKALKDNPQMPQLVIAEKWDGKLPVSMIPGSTVPLMNITPPTLTGSTTPVGAPTGVTDGK